jgi:GNAT superfamily N-acetyltransferase
MGSIAESVAIRDGSATDASVLSQLGAKTFRATYEEANDPHLVEAYIAEHYSTAIQLAELQDDRLMYLVAEVDGHIAGFALLRTDQSHPDVEGTLPIRLARIYVDTPYLGVGLGSALMERCIEECRRRGHDLLWLGVWERNEKAIAFYERWGFTSVGVEVFDVGGDKQRDVVLTLPILASA